jgi:DNA-binding SARP family transcriptional activator
MRLTSEMWVDVEEALRRLDRAEGAWRHGDLHLATTDATVASSILRRTLLTGIDGEWVALQRRRLADCLYRSYIVLAQAWRDRGDAQLSVVVAQSAVDLDPHREVGHRLLASAELRRGDRGAALRALDRCERILADELGVAPSPETIELIDQLRR